MAACSSLVNSSCVWFVLALPRCGTAVVASGRLRLRWAVLVAVDFSRRAAVAAMDCVDLPCWSRDRRVTCNCHRCRWLTVCNPSLVSAPCANAVSWSCARRKSTWHLCSNISTVHFVSPHVALILPDTSRFDHVPCTVLPSLGTAFCVRPLACSSICTISVLSREH